MATLTITYAAGSETGAALRKLAKNIEAIAANVPDKVAGGASTVLTITDSGTGGFATVQLTAGPYQSSALVS
jgi:hypothetical protein